MQAKKAKNGIAKMQKKLWQKKDINKYAQSADKNMKLADKEQYAENAETDFFKENYEKREKVYNITVEKAQTYYANGVLVSNCDTLTYLIQSTIARKKASILEFC